MTATKFDPNDARIAPNRINAGFQRLWDKFRCLDEAGCKGFRRCGAVRRYSGTAAFFEFFPRTAGTGIVASHLGGFCRARLCSGLCPDVAIDINPAIRIAADVVGDIELAFIRARFAPGKQQFPVRRIFVNA